MTVQPIEVSSRRISSQWWTGPYAGRRPFRYTPRHPRPVQRPSSLVGLPGLESQPRLRQKEGHNSPRRFGPTCARLTFYLTRSVFGGQGTSNRGLSSAAAAGRTGIQPTHPPPDWAGYLILNSSRPDGGRLRLRAARWSAASLGSAVVISRGEKTFKLQVGRPELVVSIDRLKPHLGAASLQVAEPAGCGRPPAVPGTPVAEVEDTREWTLVLPRNRRRGQR
jgi:hypothetical protein